MSRLDYCQNELIRHRCYDWKNNNCDGCNIFRAYCEGARRAKKSQAGAPSGDLISRADALEQMAQAECGGSYERCIKDGCDCPYVGRIKRLPSADRPHGMWIDVNGDGTAFKCDQCGAIACCDDNYCGNCGARMKGGDTE